MSENDEIKTEKKREGQNITLTVHDGVVGGQCSFSIPSNFKKIIDNILKSTFTEEKTDGSNDV